MPVGTQTYFMLWSTQKTLYEQYQKNPDIIAQTLLQDTLHRVLTGVDQKFLLHRNATGQQQLRLLINPEPQPLVQPPR